MLTLNPEELLIELRVLPDFERLPFPKEWYTKYHIPKTNILSMNEYITLNTKSQFLPSEGPGETRPPVSGGIRKMPESEKPEISVESKSIDHITIKTILPTEITDYIDTGENVSLKSIY